MFHAVYVLDRVLYFNTKKRSSLYKMIGGKRMFKKFREDIRKLFQIVNQTNSSLGVQCVAPDKCGLRHTTSCDKCKYNIGKYEDKIFYEPR